MTNEEAIALLQDQMNFNRTMQRNGSLYANQYKEGADALELAINALRAGGKGMNVPTMPAGQPLTLEQLRGMANKPYWHVGMREDSAPPHWSILDPLLAYHPENYDYGKCWIAYAYPPAHIDRGAWEPCKLCGTLNDEIMCQFSKKTEYDQSTTSRYARARFCPNCCRPLTEEAWAELEKRVREITG